MNNKVQDSSNLQRDDFDPSNLLELAQLASVFGAEMRNIDINYTEKPSTGTGVDFDVRNLIHKEKLSINQSSSTPGNNPVIQTGLDREPSKNVALAGFHSNAKPSSSLNVSGVEIAILQEDLKAIKEILNKINNNLGKISGMAGKIFSNLNPK